MSWPASPPGSSVRSRPCRRTNAPCCWTTLDIWFDCGGFAEKAAEGLYVHPDSVRTRLRRITELGRVLRAVRPTPRPPTSESADGSAGRS
ncbi:helix-turn-helix domain-containing protein [Streptomyces sp. NPDC088350]|uniref:helix-turn-helix domain-containing protein n=1 Tax=Streptomyces sp. NPDC088350 TaxID=3365854 RepID=UPI00382760D3